MLPEVGRVTRVTLDEGDSTLDSELSGSCTSRCQEGRMKVDADSGDTELACEQAQHLALSAGEVQQPRALPYAADFTEEQQLVARQRVHDPRGGL
jgi:hypothetical protein